MKWFAGVVWFASYFPRIFWVICDAVVQSLQVILAKEGHGPQQGDW